ncbi:MAG TPA: FtsX-like permease family protein, partial [Flavisolibacter sp.]|nr:FtsX-like permease family protein [Flavisolibacter sp.]
IGHNSDEQDWGSYGPLTYVELNPKVNPNDINNLLKNYIHKKDSKEKNTAFLFPMSKWRLYNEFANGKPTGNGRINQVHMLSGIAWIILFIACINFMNLSTANAQKRAKEVGVRKVLGAGKKQLILQFITESFMMSVIGCLVAIVIISITLPAFNDLMQKNLLIDLSAPSHITFAIFIMIVCGLLAGSYPAFYLSSFKPILVLKGFKIKAGSAGNVRKGLFVLQFSTSVVFIISTIIIYLQIQHVKNRNLGFNKDNLIEIDMQHDISGNFNVLKQDLLKTGVVQNAAMSDHVTIYEGNSDNRFKWQGKSQDNETSISFRNVSPEFISTSGMKIIEGRDFGPNYDNEHSNVIISQSLEKMMGKESAIGKIIQSPRNNKEGIFTNMTVIGIIGDYVYGNIYGHSNPVILFCNVGTDANLVYVRIKPGGKTESAISQIEETINKDNPSYPFEYKFVDDQFKTMILNEILISKIATIFAALSILISCLGLFGLAAFTAEQRTKEIGIRKVLGASVAGIFTLLSIDFLQLVFISCLTAFPIAWWVMNSWLQNYQYRIMISLWVFIIAAIAAILIALCTIAFQTVKASLVNPVKNLRLE